MNDAIKQIGEQLERIGALFTEVTQLERATQNGATQEQVQRVGAIMDQIKELSIRSALTAAASIVQDINRIANALETIAKDLDEPEPLLKTE